MKTITIVYDDSKSVPTLNLTTNGFTNAEVLVILDESKQKVKDAVIEELKKKYTTIVAPPSRGFCIGALCPGCAQCS